MKLVGAFAESEHVMTPKRTSGGMVAEVVVSGQKTAAQMARIFGVLPLTVSRIVAAHVASLALWTGWVRSTE
jgi:hypothetical protein